MGLCFFLWLVGYVITLGVFEEGKSVDPIPEGVYLFFAWPYELGRAIGKQKR